MCGALVGATLGRAMLLLSSSECAATIPVVAFTALMSPSRTPGAPDGCGITPCVVACGICGLASTVGRSVTGRADAVGAAVVACIAYREASKDVGACAVARLPLCTPASCEAMDAADCSEAVVVGGGSGGAGNALCASDAAEACCKLLALHGAKEPEVAMDSADKMGGEHGGGKVAVEAMIGVLTAAAKAAAAGEPAVSAASGMEIAGACPAANGAAMPSVGDNR